MATNKIPDGTKNVSVNMAEDQIAQVDALAARSRMTRSAYINAVLERAIKSDWFREVRWADDPLFNEPKPRSRK